MSIQSAAPRATIAWPRLTVSTLVALVMTLIAVPLAGAADRTYTADADFDEGSALNVVHATPDELALDDTVTPFGFIWVAVSTKGTVVKIDTETGEILGEYASAPAGQPTNPSRTTVDNNGNVWAGNRDGNSVLRIGLEENGQCEDRNANGVIDTSTGQDVVMDWTNDAEADTAGGVSTAADECIIDYVLVSSSGVRHVSVNRDNDVWVSGTGGQSFDLIDDETGAIVRTEGSVGFGGYGGLIDANGVIWSASPHLRWDTANPLSGDNGVNWTGLYHASYGLCIDPDGNVWETEFGPTVRKWSPTGELLGIFNHGFDGAQGCVVDSDGDVWVAHSLNGSSVGRLNNDGTYVGSVAVGDGPTGVAVDANGKVWATNYYSGTVSRIDPAVPGAEGAGAVDFTTVGLGGNPYNYSDMTGSTLSGKPDSGTWSVVYDGGEADAVWGNVNWTDELPSGAGITVLAASSADGTSFGLDETVTDGADLSVADGRYLRITVAFERSASGESPVLKDLRVRSTDVTAPATSIGEGPADGSTTADNTPTFGFASSEAGSTFECRLDGGAPFACESPFTAAGALLDGEHTLSVTASDSSGNEDPSPIVRRFTVDTAPAPSPAPTPAPVLVAPPVATLPAVTVPARPVATPRCVSRRRFSITLRPAGVRLVGAVVRVNGKRVSVRKSSGRLRATVDLRGLPRATYKVTIDARDGKRRHYRETRRYRVC